jgi:hypothetical protein
MVVVVGSFGFGFLVACFFELFPRLKLKATMRRQDRKIESLEEEIQRLSPPHAPAISKTAIPGTEE